ncbi:hypothetical protein HY732_00230 [Candidatus Uhrbacteria bacterium]|nr:hypothetical protein [Candidatus Uhrbacteria bacterium]
MPEFPKMLRELFAKPEPPGPHSTLVPMKRISIIIFTLFLALPSFAQAAQFAFDAAITQGSVSFSTSQMYAGEQVRIYANIINQGTSDISGGVSFFQGASAIAAPSFFSLKANGANEDVWVDWTPPEGTYNILIKIETNGTDQNTTNNTYVTPMMAIVKRPPLPAPAVQAPASAPTAQQGASGAVLTPAASQQAQSVAAQKKTTISSIAANIAEKLTPKLPVNPSVRTPATVQKIVPKKSIGEAAPATQVVQRAIVPPALTPKQAVLGEAVGRELVPLPGQEETSTAPIQRQDKQQGFSQKAPLAGYQNDPVRMGIALAVVCTILFLGGGWFFLKKSKE